MKKKLKNIFVDPKNKEDRQKALDALKDRNFHLNDEDNEEVRGGFLERGRGLNDDDKQDRQDEK